MSFAPLLASLPTFCSTDTYRSHLHHPFTLEVAGRRVSMASDGVMALVVDGGDFDPPDAIIASQLQALLTALAAQSHTVVQLASLREWAGSNGRDQQRTCPMCSGTRLNNCKTCHGSGRRTCDACNGSKRHACDECDDVHSCGRCDATGKMECDECDAGDRECDCTDGKVDPPMQPGRIAGIVVDRSRLAVLLAAVAGDQVRVAAAGALGIFGDGWTAILMRMIDSGEKCPTWGEQ